MTVHYSDLLIAYLLIVDLFRLGYRKTSLLKLVIKKHPLSSRSKTLSFDNKALILLLQETTLKVLQIGLSENGLECVFVYYYCY